MPEYIGRPRFNEGLANQLVQMTAQKYNPVADAIRTAGEVVTKYIQGKQFKDQQEKEAHLTANREHLETIRGLAAHGWTFFNPQAEGAPDMLQRTAETPQTAVGGLGELGAPAQAMSQPPANALRLRNLRSAETREMVPDIIMIPPAAKEEIEGMKLASREKLASEKLAVQKELADKKSAVSGDMGLGLTGKGLDLAAEEYRRTGKLPAVGMSKSAVGERGRIINRAAEMSEQRGDSAQATVLRRQAFSADSKSLANLSKQRDMILAFESTANKNLDLALDYSDKVGRTGSPILNKVYLKAKGQYAGDEDTLAFEAAIKTATNEYAKVVTGQTGGAAVSDSARAETERILNATYSPEAFKSVVTVMKQEMQNRRSGLDEQTQDILSRMGSYDSGGEKTELPKGKATGKSSADNDPLGIR